MDLRDQLVGVARDDGKCPQPFAGGWPSVEALDEIRAMSAHRKISRRKWLKGTVAFSALAGMPLILASPSAAAKASKASVHYRDYPNGMRMCHMCKFYISRGGSRG